MTIEFTVSETIPATPQEIYDAWLDSDGHAAMTGGEAHASAEVGGNFRLLFDGNEPFSRWLNGFYAWIRSRGVYYGDSGVFVRRSVYEAIGGMRPLALMEDFDFIRRLEKSGRTCCIADPPLVTSSRRFHSRRPAAIVFGWLKIHALFYLGARSETLARLYNSARR